MGKNQHVVPSDKRWAVKEEGKRKPVSTQRMCSGGTRGTCEKTC